MAGESPDRSKQRESSARRTSGSASPVPEARSEAADPRLAVARDAEKSAARGGADTATRVLSTRTAEDPKNAERPEAEADSDAKRTRDAESTESTESDSGAEDAAAGAGSGKGSGKGSDTEGSDGRLRDAVAAWVASADGEREAAADAGDEAPEAGKAEKADKGARGGQDGTEGSEPDADDEDGREAAETASEGPQGSAGSETDPAADTDDAEADRSVTADGGDGEDAEDAEAKRAEQADDAETAPEAADTKADTKADSDSDDNAAADSDDNAAEPADDKRRAPADPRVSAVTEAAPKATGTGTTGTGTEAGAKTDAAEDDTPADSTAEDKPGTDTAATDTATKDKPGPDKPATDKSGTDKASKAGAAGGVGGGGGDRADDGPAEPPVDQPTAVFKALRPPVDQPTTMLKLGGGAKDLPKSDLPKPDAQKAATGKTDAPATGTPNTAAPKKDGPKDSQKDAQKDSPKDGAKDAPKDERDAERTSKFVALKHLDDPATRKPPAPAEATAPVPAVGPERTTQQPLPPKPPLDLLAELTNTPPPPETPLRTAARRVKIWTPLVLLLVVVFAVVQSVRPLPSPTLELTAEDSYTFEGGKVDIPWPADGQAALDVQGIGTFGSSGEQKPVPIASVAKVMTAYLILREHPLKSGEKGPKIDIDQAAQDQSDAGQESTVDVTKGDSITEREALESILIASANNIARLLARWDAGSEKAFVQKMNDAAEDLGMKNTTYTDPSGLNNTTVSTAVDQVKLAKAAMQQPAFREVAAMMSYVDYKGTKHDNWNRLVGSNNVTGIKTGTTTSALGNLVFAAKKDVDGETHRIIGAVVRQPAGGPDNTILGAALYEGDKLIRAAQGALESATILKKGDVVGYADDGLGGRTPVAVTEDVTAVGWAGLSVKLTFAGGDLPHTAEAGTKVGTLTVGDGTTSAVKVPVALQKDLVEPGFGAKLTRIG
ncbi:D-alanyl-D-alanine carboxypeptidase [Streptomyces sp. NPDC059696]|uniref:D-alanyl-D-alanine carboxypeptidase n=1 Tax=Streptomyces sp. NPDC059696 TaxID=3346911 RepID=UPI0036CD5CD0